MNQHTEKEFHTMRGYQLKNNNESRLTPALEDYLEMAYRLCASEGYTRINRLSQHLNVRPSSTSKMVARLVMFGFLVYDRRDSIRLTEQGKTTGAYLMERHQIIERFFTLVGSTNPLQETELVEHMLASSTVFKLRELLEFFDQNPSILKQLQLFQNSSNMP